MNRPVPFSKNAKGVLPLFLCIAAGYLLGMVIFVISKASISATLAPDMRSAFDTETPLLCLISCIGRELFPIALTFVMGFTLFAGWGAHALAFMRSALASFSSVFVLAGAYPLHIYFIHSVYSLICLIILAFCALLSCRQSALIVTEGGKSRAPDYCARMLFYAGATVILVILRHTLTAIIN